MGGGGGRNTKLYHFTSLDGKMEIYSGDKNEEGRRQAARRNPWEENEGKQSKLDFYDHATMFGPNFGQTPPPQELWHLRIKWTGNFFTDEDDT